MGTYSARRLVISPSSGHSRAAAYNIPYRIALLDAQGGAVSPVSPEKQPPQIEHLAADNREQFGVRAARLAKRCRTLVDKVLLDHSFYRNLFDAL